MKLKGLKRIATPEKMPVITSGIEMTRGARGKENPDAVERLTGGNAVADESRTSYLVMRFLERLNK